MTMLSELVTTGSRATPLQPLVVPGAEIHARPPLAPEFAALIQRHGTLYDWASSQPQPRALRGRAPVYVATLPESRRTVVVRHAWHGGLLAPFTRDLFRRPTRAPLEVERSIELRALGIPSTDVVAYALYPAPLGLARVDVCTAYVADTADLGMIIAGLAPHIDGDGAFAATLNLLERLAQHGVVHPDLNVKNILVRTPPGRSAEALVIDVDVVRFGATPAEAMARNVARLERSLFKWKRHFGCEVAEQRIKAFTAEALARTPRTAA
ncbi:MAG: lipopolysaccharide kinase InaA family protein [Gemmatimonadaceae bacterium]|nr:lipopolysaccharide kinase InaA family protein [Gemmatimonadaceae bacterium]